MVMFNENSLKILEKRYLLKDENGNIIETPDQMLERVANTVCGDDTELKGKILEMMHDLRFLPNCVSNDTLISTDKGLISLGDVSKNTSEINMKVMTDKGVYLSDMFFNCGKKQVCKIITTNGYTVFATKEHFFRVIDESGSYVWKQLKEIGYKDFLALQRDFLFNGNDIKLEVPFFVLGKNKKSIIFPSKFTVELAEIIGYLFGDGYIHKTAYSLRLAIDLNDMDCVEKFEDKFYEVFGFIPTRTYLKGVNCLLLNANSKDLISFLEHNKISKSKFSSEIEIPKLIFSSNRNVISGFLRGLFEADGYVNDRVIELYSSSYKLLQQSQLLLLGLGVVSTLTKKYVRGNESFRLRINKDINGKLFMERIGFISDRKNVIGEAFLNPKHYKDYIPHQQNRLHEWYVKNRNVGYELYKRLAFFMIKGIYSRNISAFDFKRVCEQFPEFCSCYLKELVDLNQFYDRIDKIEKIETETETSDISVPNANSYIANGFVTHNSPTLMNAGTSNGVLSACFVIDIEDSLESIIHEAGWYQSKIHKMGGGVGINFSKLRLKGDRIKSTGGITSGVLGFLEVFNVLSEIIRQGGKRDGANMGLLNIDHPEIEDWIKAKRVEGKFRNFNLSVAVTDKFMEAVEKDLDWELKFGGKVYKTVKAKYLFDLICESAWMCGCPGMIFLDEINRNNPMVDKGMYINTTNPCVVGDTIIMTPNGNFTFKELVDKGIKEIDVLSYDLLEDEPIVSKMTNIILTRKNVETIKIYFSDSNEFVECTPDHNIYINVGLENDLKKIMAKDIKVGDIPFGMEYKVARIEYINTKKDVYNGTVKKTYNYFVYIDKFNGLLSANCGEQPLYVGEYEGNMVAGSCNLGSLNLSKYVIEPDILLSRYTWQELFDFEKFGKDIEVAVEFLDRVIDVNKYPFEFIDKGTKLTRQIGLGITGLHECLVKMNIRYDTDEALEFIRNIMHFLRDVSHKRSEEIGKEKGYFPLSNICEIKRRNLTTTTVAPTGTIGRFMLGHPYSSGIEPPYALCMSSNIIDTKIEDGIYPLLVKKLKEKGLWKKEIIDKIIENGKSIQNIEEIPLEIKKLFLVAEEISYERHILIQSTVQKYVDNAVSKTINMKNDCTIEDVKKAFMLAWKSKCKGVTIYRDLSKEKQVFEAGMKEKEKINIMDELRPIDDLTPRPSILPALSFTKKTACNTLFFNITHFGRCEKDALESFIDTNGGCLAMRNGLAITVSVYQRILETINPEFARRALEIVAQHLIGVSCPACTSKMIMEKQDKPKIKHPVDSISCPSALGKVLEFMLTHKVETTIDGVPLKFDNITFNKSNIQLKFSGNIDEIECKRCPDCGNKLIRQEGCANDTCINCGWGGCV